MVVSPMFRGRGPGVRPSGKARDQKRTGHVCQHAADHASALLCVPPTALLTINQRTGHGFNGVAARIQTPFNRRESPKRSKLAQID